VGAAVASCVAELIISGITLYLCRDYVFVSGFAKRLWKKLVAAGLMFGAVFYLGGVFSGILGTLIQVAVGAVIYFTVLVILKDDFFMSSLTYVFSKLKKLLKRN
jgi:O-antigen/teichoic acid export membrane protein